MKNLLMTLLSVAAISARAQVVRPGPVIITAASSFVGVVSNVLGASFTLDTRYTNATPYYAQISSSMTFTQQNSSDAAFFFFLDTDKNGSRCK